MVNGSLVAPADDTLKGNDRGYPALIKWFYGFDSRLTLGPLTSEERQKKLQGFDPLLSDSVTLSFQHLKEIVAM